MEKFSEIEISIGEPKERSEVANGLRVIADQIESGCFSGIAGWSDVSWSLTLDEESEEE